jgi:hypothetical protein
MIITWLNPVNPPISQGSEKVRPIAGSIQGLVDAMQAAGERFEIRAGSVDDVSHLVASLDEAVGARFKRDRATVQVTRRGSNLFTVARIE